LVSKLVVSLFIGLSVWVIWTPFKDAPWFQDIEDAGLDLAVQVSQEPATTKDISYVFLDIDAQTHQLWGEPLLTPRNKVKELIDVAVNDGARLVVVNLDLSQKTLTEGRQIQEDQQHPDDQLYDYINKYKQNYCPEKTKCPPIILERGFRSVPESPTREYRYSFLDSAVKQSAPYTLWASPLFQPSYFDGAIRRWQLRDPIPSALTEVNKALDIPESSKNLVFTDTQQYIRYQMRWEPPSSIADQWVRRYSLQAGEKGSQADSVLTVFSAGPYLKYKAETAGILKNKIVIIGSSYSSQGTMLTTPLGRMPSELVMINAIHSLLQYGEIKLVSSWHHGWIVLVVIVVSILLIFVELFWQLVLIGIVAILLGLVNVFLFEGIWINVILLFLAIYIFQIAAHYNIDLVNKYKSSWIVRQFSRLSYSALVINMVIGLTVAVLLQHFNNNPWLMNAEDASMDWLMALNRNIIPPIQDKIPPIVILDIDELTYHKWGEPLFIPRKQLKYMIEAAVVDNARLVIVDIDLSHKTPTQDSQLHPDDVALKNYLKSYIDKCSKEKANQAACPKIILRRSLSSHSSGEESAVARTTFLDEVVTKKAYPYVQWASRLFEPTEKRIVRRWKLWQSACTPDNQPEVIPSIELLTMSLVKKDCIRQDVQNALQRLQPKDCDSNNTTEESLPKNAFEICDFPVNLKDRWGINQRIKYRLSWSDSVVDQVNSQVLTILSAQPYTESPNREILNTMNGSIVVIGKSYKEGYEIYSTPLGDLPSALIIANGIHTLLLPEKLELSPIKELLITALFIVILSFFFKKFPSVWGMTFSCLLTIFIVLPFTMLYFHYGIWLTIASPLIVVTLFQVVKAKYFQNMGLIVRNYWNGIF
jgi:CHASE2 domain-containing sensor protein